MLNTFEIERESLLERQVSGKKKGMSKKFKVIAALNIIVICYFAYSALSSSSMEQKNLNFGIDSKAFKHMKARATSSHMAHYQNQMRILMHAGALEEFNNYDGMVEQAKTTSTEAGKYIQDASKTSKSVSKMINDLKTNPTSAITSGIAGALGFRQKKSAIKTFIHNNVHNFEFDIDSITSNIDNAGTTHENVRFLFFQRSFFL